MVATPFHAFEEIGRKLLEVKEYFTQQKTCATEVGEYLNHLEQTLKETITNTVTQVIKETIATTATRTYASMARTSTPETNRVRYIQQQNLERKVQRRREDNKLEVTLTADPATKEKLKQQTHAEITAKLQQTVNRQVKENPPTVPGIQKLNKSQDIRICCTSEREAEELRNLKWDDHYTGLTVRQPKYGIMIRDIPTESMNPNNLQDSELVKQLEHQNRAIGLKILGMNAGDRRDYGPLLILFRRPRPQDNSLYRPSQSPLVHRD